MTTSAAVTPEIADRAHAAFLGVAIGDALGATVEFMTAREIAAQYGVHRDIVGGGWLKLKAGAVTDDTQMSLCLARSLIRRGGFDAIDVCEEFAAWLRSKPADVGNTCRRGIRRYITNGTVEGAFAEGDAGNGAAMRCLPVALAALEDANRAAAWGIAQAHATHNHPLSDAATLALIDMVRVLVATGDVAAARTRADALVAAHPNFAFVGYHGPATAYVVDTMKTALAAFFAAGSLEECIVATVNRGDDADTTGAIAGMLAGARWGTSAIPKRWLKVLEAGARAEIAAVVPALLALSAASA